jgi:hypothetical protein
LGRTVREVAAELTAALGGVMPDVAHQGEAQDAESDGSDNSIFSSR